MSVASLPDNLVRLPNAEFRFKLLDCKHAAGFYRGGYVSGEDNGKVVACGTPDSLSGRWLSHTNPANQGSFDIQLSSQTRFVGQAHSDIVAAPFDYSGTFLAHFGGDGCCDPEPSTVAAAHTDINIIGKIFVPKLMRIRAGTVVRFCNQQPFYEKPFSYSKYNKFGNDPNRISMPPGGCTTFTVQNRQASRSSGRFSAKSIRA